ncbi:MAG: RdgB/HAM1 family non-canonical purine NTP pyrophosphatase [Deltaproteobacteria bacterium]|nr:RdgB/HAM1 family non-canonical purine NTP pyrophosphatase [Deltaproteobacteria bacterium]
MRILVATMNKGKLREYERLLANVPGLELETMASLPGPVDVVEDRDTFVGNALKKATEIAATSGITCLADDSGLEVDALGGQPGVYSARYAGEGATDAENNAKLLDELIATADEARTARFRCAIVLVDGAGREIATVEGRCEGRIGRASKGAHGFGYDPLFIPDGYHETMAELGPETKNAISHRAHAAAKLVPLLRELQNA